MLRAVQGRAEGRWTHDTYSLYSTISLQPSIYPHPVAYMTQIYCYESFEILTARGASILNAAGLQLSLLSGSI
jgi:hypothetical protein